MSSTLSWDSRPLEEARQNIVGYGYRLGDKVASPDIITANSQPIMDWIQIRKAAIEEARSREPDPAKRSAFLPESVFLLELTETLMIITLSYADELKRIRMLSLNKRESSKLAEKDQKHSLH